MSASAPEQPDLSWAVSRPPFWETHFADNPVARFVWGVEPRSRQRRLKAVFHVLLPSLVYYAVLGSVLVMTLRSMPSPTDLAAAIAFGGYLGAMVFPIFWQWTGPNTKMLMLNFEHLLTTRLSVPQIVIGFSSPQVFGIFIIASLHFVIPVCAIAFSASFDSSDYFYFLLSLGAPIFSVLSAALWDVLHLHQRREMMNRLYGMYAIGILSNPALWIIILGIVIESEAIMKIGVWTEPLGWMLRGGLVLQAWGDFLNAKAAPES